MLRAAIRVLTNTTGLGAAVSALLIVFACGCAVQRANMAPPVELPEAFSFQGKGDVLEQWWRVFNDPELDALIEKAVGDNFSIRSAWDRLRQAEQIAAKTGSQLLPTVNYQAGIERTRRESAEPAPVAPEVTYTTDYSLGLVASYEVDLWGRIRSSQKAAVIDAEAAGENVYSAAITLSANVAKTWYRLAEAGHQKELLREQLRVNEDLLKLIETQFSQGQVGASDVLRQRQLIESTQAQLNQVSNNIVLLQNELSVLIGEVPEQRWLSDRIKLVDIGGLPQLSVPSEVILERPDVLAAYKAVQAGDLRVASAVADQYPAVSISTTASTSAGDVEDLFDGWLANLAANVSGPLFDANRRRAEVKRMRAVLSQAINDYGQTVLTAVKEVEDALNKEFHQRRNIEDMRRQLQLAQKVFDLTRNNYLKGQADYLRVLESEKSVQSLQRELLTARRNLIEYRIDLYRATAGGWETKRPDMAVIDEQ